MQPRWVSSISTCVDDEALFSLARGELAPGEVARVESHLRDCSDCRAVLAEAARSLAPALPEPSTDAGSPTQIARYQVRGLIGAGASGVVYRAFDPNLQRTVAIKVLRPDLHGSPQLSARMLREAQAMARLSDPNVVAVYDVGMQDGAVYLVMEHVDGLTVSDWLSEMQPTPQRILEVFRDAGKGLLAAHNKGLVHLDFKPENVLVAADGRALVTDFGLAREAERRLTQISLEGGNDVVELYAPTRGIVGTPAYMAPELFDGGAATAQSDQFAYCVALFAALAQRHPFGAGEGISLAELIDRMRVGPLGTASALRSRHSDRLWPVLLRGMATDPSARFLDMRGLLTALDRAASSSWTRRPLLIALACALLWLAWLGASTWRAQNTEQAPTLSAQPVSPQGSQQAQSPDAGITPATTALPNATTADKVRAKANRGRTRTKRAAAKKQADVRYRDWLKDPFPR